MAVLNVSTGVRVLEVILPGGRVCWGDWAG